MRNKGNDGSGINCGKIDDDSLSVQKISEEKVFFLNDNLSPENQKRILKEWEIYRSNMPGNEFSKKKFIKAKIVYWMLIVFGYTCSMKMLNLASKTKRKLFS